MRTERLLKSAKIAFIGTVLALSFLGSVPAHAQSGDFIPKTPQLNVQMGDLRLATEIHTEIRNQQKYLTIPYLAQYIAAAYKYAIGLAMVLAAVMIAYGGFLYILGSSMQSVSRGKEVITNSLIGLILVLSSFTLLNLVNPETAKLKPLEIPAVKPDPINTYMGANEEAPQTLSEVGIPPREKPPIGVAPADVPRTGDPGNPEQVAAQSAAGTAAAAIARPTAAPEDEWAPPPSTAKFPTDLTIPKNCPGRDPKFGVPKGTPAQDPDAYIKIGGQILGNKASKTISYAGKTLDEKVVSKWLEEQSVTGIPAGAVMAQILTESDAPKCVVLNMFSNPSICAKTEGAKYFNFGGIGCSQGQVPKDTCAHVAWGPGKGMKSGKMYADSCTEGEGNASIWNRGVAATCTGICQSSTRDTFRNCGENCYPQKSHSSLRVGDDEVWWPSVQCSRKYKTAHEFLASHLGFVRFCLPYNDSVYKFAYCIGASTYAGATGSKGPLLAEIIERNCLCGSRDSTGCKRDKKLEEELVKGIIKKRNLNLFGYQCAVPRDKDGKCPKNQFKNLNEGIDYAGIVKALQQSTQGALNPREWPQNDLLQAQQE